jgi:hypothetical protein
MPEKLKGSRMGRLASIMRATFLLPPAILLVWSLPAWAQSSAGDPEISEEAVKKAIDRGMHCLLEAQKPDGSWEPYGMGSDLNYRVGSSAIATYALLEGGAGMKEPKITAALDWLAGHETNYTYELGLRCNVWLLAGAKVAKYRANLQKDTQALLVLCKDGAYGYGGARNKWFQDNSNSQYGLLGVWAAARDERIENVPPAYWPMVLKYWLNGQERDGGWGYLSTGGPLRSFAGPSYGAMTCAGIASVLVCLDNINTNDYLHCNIGQDPATRSAQAGLDWLGKNFGNARPPRGLDFGDGYFYFGLERVGLASGMMYFGSIDWYHALCPEVLATQDEEGAWQGRKLSWPPRRGKGDLGATTEAAGPTPKKMSGPDVVETAYHLLFLIRGHAPVLFNKLQFGSLEGAKPVESDWNCRPRDLSHLCAWLGRNYEQTFNWQVVNFKIPVRQWHDAPILCISGSRKPDFTPEQIDALRAFVYQGGTIFSCTECGGQGFREGIRKAYARMFPDYDLVALSADHEIYGKKVGEALPGRPKFLTITNNVRPLVLHVEDDLPLAWQSNSAKTRRECFQAMANVVMYVTDKGMLHARGGQAWPAEFNLASDAGESGAGEPPRTPPQPRGSVKIVRLKWAGNWNPEPLALERFSRMFARQTHIRLAVAEPVHIDQVGNSGAAVALLGGQGQFKPAPESLEALRKFIQGGGTLLVSAAGGDAIFAQDALDAIKNLIPGQRALPLDKSHGIYNVAGLPDGTLAMGKESGNPIRYRRRTIARLTEDDSRSPRLRGIDVGAGSDRRTAVIFSREDLADAGLVGYYSYAVDGYDPGEGEKGSAYRVMRNIVIYAVGAQGKAAMEKPDGTTKPASTLPKEP